MTDHWVFDTGTRDRLISLVMCGMTPIEIVIGINSSQLLTPQKKISQCQAPVGFHQLAETCDFLISQTGYHPLQPLLSFLT